MLNKQWWIHYYKDIVFDWRQCFDEGRDVAFYKDICEYISKNADTIDNSKLASEIAKSMENALMRDGYAFVEPSDYDGIWACRDNKRHVFDSKLSEESLRAKLAGAWIGRIAGCLLGKPVEGVKRSALIKLLQSTNNYPMERYISAAEFPEGLAKELELREDNCWADKVNGFAPYDDDTNYTVFGLKLIEEFTNNFTANDVLEAWLYWIPMFSCCTAERVAYRNAATGLLAPATATYRNPYREWIGAQIRGDFFGYFNFGKPEEAARMGFLDASISHTKNGIYGEMFVCALIAAAFVCSDREKLVEAALDEIPNTSRLHQDIESVLNWYTSGIVVDEAIDRIHAKYNDKDPFDWCHTNPNAMVVVMALLYGEGDFGKSICLSVQAAFDTDCNGATVGSIVGAMVGRNEIPKYWYEIFNEKLQTTISSYEFVTVNEMVDKTILQIKKYRNEDLL